MYKAILFDLDGTLTDSGEGITKSVQYALEKVGKPEPDLREAAHFCGTAPLWSSFRNMRELTKKQQERQLRFTENDTHPVGIYENELYPGIPEMLSGTETKRIQACHCVFQTREFREDRCGIISILILILTRWLEVSLRVDEPIRQR